VYVYERVCVRVYVYVRVCFACTDVRVCVRVLVYVHVVYCICSNLWTYYYEVHI